MSQQQDKRVRYVVGCMTGTSLDGLDAALVRIEGEGLEMSATFLSLHSQPFDDGLRQQLLHLAEGKASPPLEYMRAGRMLGVMHAQAVAQLLAKHPVPDGGKPDFVVAHGQTIWHAPKDTLSWQLFDPWPVVRHVGVPVCYDLRQADLIAGGEGAPITPLADWVMYRTDAHRRSVWNLGGICNVSNYDNENQHAFGYDLCPCNLLIDGVVQRLYPSVSYDADGVIAASGRTSDYVLERLRTLPDQGKRTLGREDVSSVFLDDLVESSPSEMRPEDLVASAVYAVAEVIGQQIDKLHVGEEIVLAGGGARNRVLVDLIRPYPEGVHGCLILSDELGIPCEAREAMGFAVLGALSQDKVSITKNSGVAGAWVYP